MEAARTRRFHGLYVTPLPRSRQCGCPRGRPVVPGDVDVCQQVSHCKMCPPAQWCCAEHHLPSDTLHQRHTSQEGWFLWDSACLAQIKAPASLLGCKFCLDGPNQPLCAPEPTLPACAPALRKMDEFWTGCCQATQIYLATTCLQCEWTAQHALLPGSHGYRHLLLFHTFVGPVNLLCSPYLSASTDCLALSFLSDHYLCPTTFSTDTEKTWEARSVICFRDTTQAVQITPHPASVSPLALLSLICCIAAPCAAEESAHKGPCEWHRAAALVTRLAGSGVWVHIKNNIQSSLGFCLCKQHKDTCFLTPSLCFQLSPSPFHLLQLMPATTCPPFMWTCL